MDPAASGTDHLGSATSVSTDASSCSVSFVPAPPKTLMPLSSYGLCDAEITIPASNPSVRARYATAGVGTTPALTTVAPSLVSPRASSSSIHDPDSRVSRPITNRRVLDGPKGPSPLVNGVFDGPKGPSPPVIRVSCGDEPL